MDCFDFSNPIDLKRFLEECKLHLSQHDLCVKDGDEEKRFEYPVTFDKSRFRVSSLMPEESKDFLKKIDNTNGLKLLEYRKSQLQNRKGRKSNRNVDKFSRFISDSPWIHKLIKSAAMSSGKEKEKIHLPDILLKVHFYKPLKEKALRYVRAQEFDVLGQTYLHSLKEKFNCPSDNICSHNYAADPDAPLGRVSKDIYKSNFFFIEGMFYNDVSNKRCKDLSEVIKEWAKERKDAIGPFKYSTMTDVKFIDLILRLGQPYLYMHQGDCEHLVIFSDIRLVTDQDCHDASKYPIETFKNTMRRATCQACGTTAKWIVFNSSFAPDDPCFLCELCLKMMHHDDRDRLIDKDIKVFWHPLWTNDADQGEDCRVMVNRSKLEPAYYA